MVKDPRYLNKDLSPRGASVFDHRNRCLNQVSKLCSRSLNGPLSPQELKYLRELCGKGTSGAAASAVTRGSARRPSHDLALHLHA